VPIDVSKDENLERYWVDLKAGPMAHSLEKLTGHCLVESKAGLKTASTKLYLEGRTDGCVVGSTDGMAVDDPDG
jgi:hypothetical protein